MLGYGGLVRQAGDWTVVQRPKVGGDLRGLRSTRCTRVILARGVVAVGGRAWRMVMI